MGGFYYSIRYTTTIDKSTGLPYPYQGSPVPESMRPFMDISDDMASWWEDCQRITLGDQIFEDQTSTNIQDFIYGIPSYDEIEQTIIKKIFDPKEKYKVMDYLIKIEDGSELISLDPIELVEPVTPVTPVTPIEPVESDESDVRTLADINIDKTTLKHIMKKLHCNSLDETKEMLKKYKLDCSAFTWSRKDHETFISALEYFAQSENFYAIEYDCRP